MTRSDVAVSTVARQAIVPHESVRDGVKQRMGEDHEAVIHAGPTSNTPPEQTVTAKRKTKLFEAELQGI